MQQVKIIKKTEKNEKELIWKINEEKHWEKLKLMGEMGKSLS